MQTVVLFPQTSLALFSFFINIVMQDLTAAVFIMKALISCEGMSLNEEWGMGNSVLLRLSWINCCHSQTKQEWDLMQDLLPSNAGNIC